jgi:hypothetical protein
VLKLLAAEHIDPDLVRDLLARKSSLDVVQLHEVGLLGADDGDSLEGSTAERHGSESAEELRSFESSIAGREPFVPHGCPTVVI